MPSLRIYKYFPNNPNVVVYNFNRSLVESASHMIKDGYIPEGVQAWIRELAALPQITEMRVSRYKVLIKRDPDCTFEEFLDTVEHIMTGALEPEWVPAITEEPTNRSFPLPPGRRVSPQAFKNPADGQSDPLAAQLFAIPGTNELVFRDDTIIVYKGHLFPWAELAPAIEDALVNWAWE